MTIKNQLTGTLKIRAEHVPLEEALTRINHIERILGKRISLTSSKTIVVEEQLLTDIPNLILVISKQSNQIKWLLRYKDFKFNITFTIDKTIVKINLYSQTYKIITYLQEWIYIFYRLQEYIENGGINLPDLEYKEFNQKSISMELTISKPCQEIYRTLTEQQFMRQIFAKFPECNVDTFSYTWGWIEEGPNNLISYKRNALLIHDFIVDFTPIGYIKWALTGINENKSLLSLTHKDLNLEDEINPIRAFFSYRNGWLYFLAKVKDLAENNYCTITFDNELLD